jgi:hypothetical protein
MDTVLSHCPSGFRGSFIVLLLYVIIPREICFEAEVLHREKEQLLCPNVELEDVEESERKESIIILSKPSQPTNSNKRRFHLNEFFALHLPLSCYHCYPLPSLHKKTLDYQLSSSTYHRQHHLHRDEKIQLHFTEIATRFFQQLVQPLTS